MPWTITARRAPRPPHQGPRPSLDDLHPPEAMPGMEEAVTRILAAVRSGEHILVHGDFDVDGTFEVTSFELGDGLVPGTYRVRIECWEQYPGDFRPGVSYVPEKYEPEQLVIEDDTREAVEVSYDVPPKL